MLNPELYNALLRSFGSAVVHNENERVSLSLEKQGSALSGGTERLRIRGGEYYAVNCPFCDDEHKHLWVSHVWDTYVRMDRDRVFNGGLHTACCYRRDCLKDKAKRSRFTEMVWGPREVSALTSGAPAVRAPVIIDGVTERGEPVVVPFPDCHRHSVRPLPPAALAYLASRPNPVTMEELEFNYSAVWHEAPFYFGAPAIVFPVFAQGKYLGWQERYALAGDPPGDLPKYHIPKGFKKSWCLFNIDRASYYPYVVLTEGVFDAVKAGPSGVAMFGKAPGVWQTRLLQAKWGNGALIWLPDNNDPDSLEKSEKMVGEWNSSKQFKLGAHRVLVPGPDPGACSTEEIWREITKYTSLRPL